MKILAVLSRFPYPIEKGDKLRAYYQLKGLSAEHEIHLICLDEKQPNPADLAEVMTFCKTVEVIHFPLIGRLFNLISGLFNEKPFQVNYFRSEKMRRRIGEIVKEKQIDLCYVQLIRLGMNTPRISGLCYFLDYMDAFSVGMKNRIPLSSWYMKPFVKLEAQRLERYEKAIAVNFDGFSIISDTDRQALGEQLSQKVEVIRNGVGDVFFESPPDNPMETAPANVVSPKYDLIFTGNMGYHPNVQAGKFLVEAIVPALQSLGIEPVVCLAGARPSPEIRALESESVHVTGFVDDLRTFMWQSRMLVAPLLSGQGLQNKLLESMAMGLPTLTTSLANSALMANDGTEILVCESPSEFAEKIKWCLDNPEKAGEIGLNGRKFVEREYKWEASNAKLEKALLKTFRNLTPNKTL